MTVQAHSLAMPAFAQHVKITPIGSHPGEFDGAGQCVAGC
jgi:hypothetical protein